uniref:Uncharacterized protein n=1 Tax=Arion vulgaris TaxID=1028688 RepID=A0A0B7BZC6_9EUPU
MFHDYPQSHMKSWTHTNQRLNNQWLETAYDTVLSDLRSDLSSVGSRNIL